jgi:hypothetical protein
LAELATKTHIARASGDVIAKIVSGTLDTITASMLKYWIMKELISRALQRI